MSYVNIRLELYGTYCNDWPRFKITGNNITYFDQQVKENLLVEFTMPLEDKNSLVLTHYDKSFGENNVWDTHSKNGKITADRAVRLIKLELDDVDIKKYITRFWPFYTDDGRLVLTDFFGYNGSCTINFESPVYNWIIKNLVHDPADTKLKAQDLIVETSHNDLFNYENDLATLKEIEALLETHAHLFNKSS